nr:hypothetical protein [Micromonospora sp. DSM 115978]
MLATAIPATPMLATPMPATRNVGTDDSGEMAGAAPRKAERVVPHHSPVPTVAVRAVVGLLPPGTGEATTSMDEQDFGAVAQALAELD